MQDAIHTVIFLGAGASKADGAPLQFELLRDYFLSRGLSGTAMDEELANFFEGFYGIDTSKVSATTSFPTFEEVLGTLELALQRDENFKIAGITWNRDRIQKCREHLITLICTVLADKLGKGPISDKPVSKGENVHRNLMRTHFQTDPGTCFISLNYDLLIDNAILSVRRTPYYGTTFANPPVELGQPIGLYKLHGSLNWLRCPTCSSLTQTGDDKGASYPIESRARCARLECLGETSPIVIPPTFFKVMADLHLQQVWHCAERALAQATTIVFCGYSLPDADMHIRYLLKRAELNRRSAPYVFVINDHAGKAEPMKREEEARYRRLFCQPSKVRYLPFSFEDFAWNGLTLLD